MTYNQFSADTREAIDHLAAMHGVTREEVINQFERLYAGHGPAKNTPNVFSV